MLREGRAFFFSKIREIARSKACRSEMKYISSVVNQRYLIGGITKRLKTDGGESVEVAVCFSAEKIFPPSWAWVDEKLITIGPQAAIRV